MLNYIDPIREGLRFFSAPVWRFEGKEKGSGGLLSTLFSGPEKQYEYVLRRIYGSNAIERYFLGRHAAPGIDRVVRNHGCTLAIIAAPRYALSVIRRPTDICIPWWIDSEVECNQVLGSGRTKSLESDLRKIRRNGFRYTIANTAENLEFFYQHIYGPSICAAHGDSALLSSPRKRLKQLLDEKAQLLLVKHGRKTVGGLLIDFRGRQPAHRDIGVLEGNPQLKKLGVTTAAIYFGVEYIKSLGYGKLNLGLSRCFMDDGVLLYKRKWRPTFVRPSRNGFLIRVLELNDAARSFILSSNCITTSRGKLFNTCFDIPAKRDAPDSEKVRGATLLKGTSGMILYDVSGNVPLRVAPPEHGRHGTL